MVLFGTEEKLCNRVYRYNKCELILEKETMSPECDNKDLSKTHRCQRLQITNYSIIHIIAIGIYQANLVMSLDLYYYAYLYEFISCQFEICKKKKKKAAEKKIISAFIL